MSRAVSAAGLMALAVLAQAALLNRLSLPLNAAPDLVLVLLLGIALRTGPSMGAATGFAAGLAMDVLPPADAELGRNALLLCLVGYAAGSLALDGRRSPRLPILLITLSVPGLALGSAVLDLILGGAWAGWSPLLLGLAGTLAGTLLLSLAVLPPLERLWPLAEADDRIVPASRRRPWHGRRPR